MKSLHALLFLLVMGLGLTSCDNGKGEVTTGEVTTQPSNNPTESQVPAVKESKNLAEKQAAHAASTSTANTGAATGGVTVEKTERTQQAPVDDAGVDYGQIAKAVCQCGAQYIGKNEQQGDVLVTKGDSKYQDAVDCSLKKKEKITDKTLNRQTLVKAIKKECNAIPPTLVMSFILSMEKEGEDIQE